MAFKILSTVPQNPSEFISMLSKYATEHMLVKAGNDFCVGVARFNDYGIFQCAYGFFYVSKSKKYSKKFYNTLEGCKGHLKKVS